MPLAQQIWQAALGELELQMTRPNFNTWLKGTTGISFSDGVFTVGAPSSFIAEYLQTSQYSLIERTVMRLATSDVKIHFQVVGNNAEITNLDNSKVNVDTAVHHRFNPRYTFESFVTGSGNQLAHAAAVSAAKGPGQLYNPLFIYGGVGLGKTHLLHAIGHVASKNNLQALYVSGEQFTNDFIGSIRSGNGEEFRSRYRSVDILLVDDIQFISGKSQTEECFFHTFNELHNGSRQIILSSDRSPKEMPLIEDRLRSRFEWGLTVDIQPPEFETRMAILKAKSDRDGITVIPEVLEIIAREIRSNVRELEGSLNRITAYSRLLQADITPDLALRALTDIGSSGKNGNSADSIIREVACSFSLETEDLTGRKRDKTTALARQLAMYLLKSYHNYPLERIGELLGGRNASTVSHACEKIARDIDNNPPLKRQVESICSKFSSSSLS
ncbi:MAG: chromosomal replication initiator protein DnaA [Dehalococcoidales bacterium]|nr:chromosomal replication initiator protein DnaA [Dehalococcoidales bacterium]